MQIGKQNTIGATKILTGTLRILIHATFNAPRRYHKRDGYERDGYDLHTYTAVYSVTILLLLLLGAAGTYEDIWTRPHQVFRIQSTLSQPVGQIMPTTTLMQSSPGLKYVPAANAIQQCYTQAHC